MDWRSKAACLSVDPELFFPIGNTGPAIAQAAEAKAEEAAVEVAEKAEEAAAENAEAAEVETADAKEEEASK